MGNVLLVVSLGLVVLSFILWLYLSKPSKQTAPLLFSIISLISIAVLFSFYVSLFWNHQFQYVQVHQNSNMAMPKLLLLASVWSGQSGSLLSWILSLTFMSAFIFKDKAVRSKVFPLLFLFLGILLMMFLRSDPFALNPLLPADGIGLNPVLSHPLMIIHPPFAFIAYSCIILAFIYAMISLSYAFPDTLFQKISLYAKMAFTSLSFAILLGSLWAYEASGWGGYWSFDPIENGSLIAFLLLALLMHLLWAQKRYRIFHKHIILCSIFLMFSIIHMVFLIRSGLLSQVSAHSYVDGNLLWVLFAIDLTVLFVPLLYFFIKHNKLPTHHKQLLPKKIKPFRTSHWFLISIAGLLFVYTHLPFFDSSLIGAFLKKASSIFPFFVLILSFAILFMLLLFYKHAFRRKRSRRYSAEKFLFLFFVSFVLCYLFQPSIPINILSVTGLVLVSICFLCFSCLYAVLYYINKTPVKAWGSLLFHSSLPCLVLAAVFFTLPSNTYWLHLLPHEKTNIKELSASFELIKSQQLPIYTGTYTEYPVQVSIQNSNYTALPAIWSYQRNQASLEINKTSIHAILGSDHHLLPTGKGIFRIKEGTDRFLGQINVAFIEHTQEKLSDGLINETFTLSFTKDEQNDTIQLKRLVSTHGRHLRSDPVYVSLLNDTIQLNQYQNKTLVFSSKALSEHLEANYSIKALARLIPWSYYLLLIASIWILIKQILSKKTPEKVNSDINKESE
jgi:cytochrome c biogenesis factor